jgi:hypothetical protein
VLAGGEAGAGPPRLGGTADTAWRYPIAEREKKMLAAIAVVLVLIWLVSFLALHVSSFLIHILLLAAVVSIVLHFLRRRSA